MAKNRKEHRKQCRLNGERAKAERLRKLAHKRDLETLQRVLNHTERLRAERPELFDAVMKAVDALAEENGLTREQVMTHGVTVLAENGEQVLKTPEQIITDIANIKYDVEQAFGQFLYGSDIHASLYTINGVEYALGDFVAAAHAESGYTVAEWNGLPAHSRNKLIDTAVVAAGGPSAFAPVAATGTYLDAKLAAQGFEP